jgi:hypothetical protein
LRRIALPAEPPGRNEKAAGDEQHESHAKQGHTDQLEANRANAGTKRWRNAIPLSYPEWNKPGNRSRQDRNCQQVSQEHHRSFTL